MSASFSERARYAAYAAVAIVAFIGYFSLDAQTERPAREAARIFPQSGGLPALSLAGSDGPRGPAATCSPLPRPLNLKLKPPLSSPLRSPQAPPPKLCKRALARLPVSRLLASFAGPIP